MTNDFPFCFKTISFVSWNHVNKKALGNILGNVERGILLLCVFLFMDDKLLRGSGNQILGINFKSNTVSFYIFGYGYGLIDSLRFYLYIYAISKIV